MPRPLSELTLEELWQIFPIVLRDHNPQYSQWYREEAAALTQAIGLDAIARMEHIGSTAVPGLLAKPTVDILLELTPDPDMGQLQQDLAAAGWGCMHSQIRPVLQLDYNKGYTPEGFAERVFHLHIRALGDPDELYFRDYLRANPPVAAAYARLKGGLLQAYEHDRDGYTAAKTAFVREHTTAARAQFGGRYLPKPAH